jgi:cytochrome P450
VIPAKTYLEAELSSFAGSDTTAISLRAVFYYLCKNPEIYTKAVDEILAADKQGNLSEYITYAESQQLIYLQACIKEALRMHPAVGQLLERTVPEGGVVVHEKFLPSGTVVGINPWVVARDTKIYGQDAHIFRPERWLNADAASLKLMDRSWLAVSYCCWGLLSPSCHSTDLQADHIFHSTL